MRLHLQSAALADGVAALVDATADFVKRANISRALCKVLFDLQASERTETNSF
jgi:hypothetical protein